MGDCARGLVSYTISIHVAGRLQSQCIRTALCLFVRAHRTHTKRRSRQLDCGPAQNKERQSECGDREEDPARLTEVMKESNLLDFYSNAQMTNRAASCPPFCC